MKITIRILIYLALCMILISGCSSGAGDNTETDDKAEITDNTASETMETEVSREDYLTGIINNVASVEGTDAFDERYEEPIRFELNDDETDALLECLKGAAVIEHTRGSGAYFRLILKNSSDELLDEWEIDTAGRIAASCGQITDHADDPEAIRPDSRLDAWLEDVEKTHGINFESVLGRAPGKHYFDDIAKAESAHLSEVTDNNFIEGTEYDLSEEELTQLRNLAGNINIRTDAGKNTDGDLRCRIYIYDNCDAGLHTIDIDKDGTISDSGWTIEGDRLEQAVSAILKSSGIGETD